MNSQLLTSLEGLQQGQLKRINKINNWYAIYDGEQEWETKQGLDYEPTKKITNYIKKIVDKKARFMFGKEPYFNLQGDDLKITEEKEKLLQEVLRSNKWHSKLLKAKKDCSIGGNIAIKIQGSVETGIKIVFSPAQEFIAITDEDDIDTLEKVVFFYNLNDSTSKSEQRVKKQVWQLINGKCVIDEGIYDGYGNVIEIIEEQTENGLDFLPIVIVQNGGLTGDTKGYSDVEALWSNQDAYNKLTSDDQDALKFQMFGQTVLTDADETSIDSITIAPGALVDLQTDLAQANNNRQAKAERLESNFTYEAKYIDTVNRVKADMYDLMDVPDTSLEKLRGMMASGQSMKAVYWDLIATCDEDWTEWGPALSQVVDYIFRVIETYNIYGAGSLAAYETVTKIERTYPIAENELEQRRMDLQEVISNARSKQSYIKKWSEIDDVEEEYKQILDEKKDSDSFLSEL